MSYLCAGVFAEGPTDYAFLLALLDQILPRIAHTALPHLPTIGDAVGIDTSGKLPVRRADRIAAAIDEFWGQCTLFVIHSDGEGDLDRALRERIAPGIEVARALHPDLAAAACVPVREIEAWILADERPLEALLKLSPASLLLPSDPESVGDPKRELERILSSVRSPRRRPELYAFFGANSDIDRLRRLRAFREFEAQLLAAIRIAAGER